MNKKGFTMVEIIVVLAMGAIVSAVIGQTFVGNFKSYSNMSITQIQTLALNDVNEILNEQVEDAMDVAIVPASSDLDDDEYGIYTDMSGNLQLKHSENVMTLYTSDTGAINILELYVLKDVFEMDQLQFNLNYNGGDGTDNLISRTLSTQLFNDSSVDYNGIGYNGSNDEYLLRNDADMLVFKKAINTATPLDPDAILSYYLSDPSFTVEDKQTYIFGMLYWDGSEYQVFNNLQPFEYPDNGEDFEYIIDLTADKLLGDDLNNIVKVDFDIDLTKYLYLLSENANGYVKVVAPNNNRNFKFRLGTIIKIGDKYWRRTGNKGEDIKLDKKNVWNKFEFTFNQDGRWEEITEDILVTLLSSEQQQTVEYEDVLPENTPNSSGSYELGDMVYAGTSLYWYDGDGFIKLDELYNEDIYPGLIVTKDDIYTLSDETVDFSSSESYAPGAYVKVTYADGAGYTPGSVEIGHKEIFKKVTTGDDTNPGTESDRVSGGWQLQSNQYDPNSCYVVGDQVFIFGNEHDEVYVITFDTDIITESAANTVASAVNDYYNQTFIDNPSSYSYSNAGISYTIEKYTF